MSDRVAAAVKLFRKEDTKRRTRTESGIPTCLRLSAVRDPLSLGIQHGNRHVITEIFKQATILIDGSGCGEQLQPGMLATT